MKIFFKKNENLMAWIISILCGPLIVIIFWSNWPVQNKGNINNKDINNSNANNQLIIDAIRLKARIRICEKASDGESQYKSSCSEVEIKKLPEYRSKLATIEQQIANKNPSLKR